MNAEVNKEINKLYDNIKSCYIDPKNENTAKAKSFRTFLEQFANIVSPNTKHYSSLTDRLIEFFRSRQKYKAEERLLLLLGTKGRLNNIVHTDSFVSEKELKRLLNDILFIISYSTDIAPNLYLQIISGLSTTKKWYTIKLNKEQEEAVLDDSKIISVNAGPGTGKTYLLVWKILQYLDNNPNKHVVALSYTNSAANQLLERFSTCVQESRKEGLVSSTTFPNVVTSTIHSYCLKLIMDFYKQKKQKI